MPAWILKICNSCPNTTLTKKLINAVLPTPDSPMMMIGILEIALWIIRHILKVIQGNTVILYLFSLLFECFYWLLLIDVESLVSWKAGARFCKFIFQGFHLSNFPEHFMKISLKQYCYQAFLKGILIVTVFIESNVFINALTDI